MDYRQLANSLNTGTGYNSNSNWRAAFKHDASAEMKIMKDMAPFISDDTKEKMIRDMGKDTEMFESV